MKVLIASMLATSTAALSSTATLPERPTATTNMPIEVDVLSPLPLPPLQDGFQRIFLLRHGETDCNRMGKYQGGGIDMALNQAGIEQAKRAASLLQHVPLDVVASSHLQRSVATADCIRKEQRIARPTTIVDKRFGEMLFGDMEGTTVRGANVDPVRLQAFQQHLERMKLDESIPWPGRGESFGDVRRRATAALDQLVQSHASSLHFCIVAHGRANKVLLNSLLQRPILKQGNTCVNVLDRCVLTGTFQAHLINFTEHVEDSTVASPS